MYKCINVYQCPSSPLHALPPRQRVQRAPRARCGARLRPRAPAHPGTSRAAAHIQLGCNCAYAIDRSGRRTGFQLRVHRRAGGGCTQIKECNVQPPPSLPFSCCFLLSSKNSSKRTRRRHSVRNKHATLPPEIAPCSPSPNGTAPKIKPHRQQKVGRREGTSAGPRPMGTFFGKRGGAAGMCRGVGTIASAAGGFECGGTQAQAGRVHLAR